MAKVFAVILVILWFIVLGGTVWQSITGEIFQTPILNVMHTRHAIRKKRRNRGEENV